MKKLLVLAMLFFTLPVFAQAQNWFEPVSVSRGGTLYTQKVAFNAFGGSKIVAGSPPTTPTQSFPANGAEDIGAGDIVLFNWSNVATTTVYEWELYIDGEEIISIASSSPAISEYEYRESFLPFTTYYWRVRATNAYGSSAWTSPKWSFTTTF